MRDKPEYVEEEQLFSHSVGDVGIDVGDDGSFVEITKYRDDGMELIELWGDEAEALIDTIEVMREHR